MAILRPPERHLPCLVAQFTDTSHAGLPTPENDGEFTSQRNEARTAENLNSYFAERIVVRRSDPVVGPTASGGTGAEVQRLNSRMQAARAMAWTARAASQPAGSASAWGRRVNSPSQ